MDTAIVRAQAYIGDHAPPQFIRHLSFVETYVIQPQSLYRMCVPGSNSGRTYCVIVRLELPYSNSVSFSGYEPNSEFAQGLN
jgi:hypothetical protein